MRVFILRSFLVLGLLGFRIFCSGQAFLPDIQFINFEDSVITSLLRDYIDLEEQADSIFVQNQGYLLVDIRPTIRNGPANQKIDRFDTVLTISVFTCFMHPDESVNKFADLYPSYFSFIDGRLVAVMSDLRDQYFGYSPSSRALYTNVVGRYISSSTSKNSGVLKLEKTIIHILENRHTGELGSPVIIRPPGYSKL